MKRFFLLLPSLLALAPFVACGDDASSGRASLDSGVAADTSLPDVSVTPLPDAADAADAAPTTAATIVVTSAGAPLAGVSVVFGDAAGTALGTVVTGADGKATRDVTDGDQITVALGAEGSRHLITYVAVKRGDVINVVERSHRPISVALATNIPDGGSSNNIDTIVGATCIGDTDSPVLIDLVSPECITGPTFSVLSRLSVGVKQWASFKKGITPAATGTTNVTGLSSWAPTATFAMTLLNVPNTVTSGYLWVLADNQPLPFGATGGSSNGSNTFANFNLPTGLADAYQVDVRTFTNVAGFNKLQSISQRFAAGGTSKLLDLAQGSMPSMPTLDTIAVTNVTPARPVLTWTASASLAGTDAGIASMSFGQTLDAGGEIVDWAFIVPPGTLTVTAPQLPPSLVAFTPQQGSPLAYLFASFIESDVIASYDLVRAQVAAFGFSGRLPLGFVSTNSAQPTIPPLPADGSLHVTQIEFDGF